MKLPAAERAIIAQAKIRDYLLSTAHPVGRFKAPFFVSLGYTSANWRRLEEDLLALAVRAKRNSGRTVRTAQKYEIRGTLNGPSGRPAGVLTVWIILSGGDAPQLVTAFPGEMT